MESYCLEAFPLDTTGCTTKLGLQNMITRLAAQTVHTAYDESGLLHVSQRNQQANTCGKGILRTTGLEEAELWDSRLLDWITPQKIAC